MRTLVAFAFLFTGLLALQADHHGKSKDLPGCCADGCCCTGADECTGCGCTGGPLEAKSNPSEEGEYPLDTCVVSGEDLYSMGDPITYWHKVDGQPDRMVMFCCDRCQSRFKSDPDKFLAKLDAATKAGCCGDESCCTDGKCSGCEDGACDVCSTA